MSDQPTQMGPAMPPPVGKLSPAQYSVVPITDANIGLAVNSLDDLAADVMARSKIPGMSVAVVHNGEVAYAEGFGVRKLGEPAEVNTRTVFQLASISKSISSSVVARAVGKGELAWSDPVVKYLPQFELSDPAVTRMVTIGDLFSHRSGIPGGAGDDMEGLGFSRGQIIRRLRHFPLSPFRVSYGYTNFGLTTGAEAVATAVGMSWADLCDRLLYQPLGMSSTSSRYADFLRETNRAALHAKVDKGFAPKYIRDADAQAPAGGVSSTVLDLCTWMKLNLASGRADGERFVAPAPLLEAHTAQAFSSPAQAPDARSDFYGYGVNVETTSSGQVRWGHSGAFFVGAGTCYGMLPAGNVGIIVLTNAAPVGAAEAMAFSFTDLARTGHIERDWLGYFGPIFAHLFVNKSRVVEPPPADPTPPRHPADYVGTYTNEAFGNVAVAADDRKLSITLGPKNLSASLRHYDGDVFAWFPPGGNGDPLSAVTFAGTEDRKGDGKAKRVTLEFINGYGLGTFERA